MSKTFTARIEGFPEAQAQEVARRAGWAESLAGLTGALVGGLAVASVRSAAWGLARMSELAQDTAREMEVRHTGLTAAAASQIPSNPREIFSASGCIDALRSPELALLRAGVVAESGDLFRNAEQRIEELREAVQRGVQPSAVDLAEAVRCTKVVQETVDRAVRKQAQVEAEITAEASSDALSALGYEVRTPRFQMRGKIALKGTADDGRAIYVMIDPARGQLTADMSGQVCSGGTTCESEGRRFLAQLERRGISVRLLASKNHGRAEGGELAHSINRLFEESTDPQKAHQPEAVKVTRG